MLGDTTKVYGEEVIPFTVVFVVPFEYVMFQGCVPVKAIDIVVLELQIVPLPEIIAVGLGLIIMAVAVLQVVFEEHAA